MIVPELASPEPPAAPPPAAARPQPRPTAPRHAQPSGYSARKLAAIGAGLLAFGVLFYFGLGWADAFQKRFNEKQRQIAAKSDGGELTHIANLYVMLDKTEPEHMAAGIVNRGLKRRGGPAAGMKLEPDAPPPNPAEKLPLLPAQWTLDLPAAKIPEGRANGGIAGANFVVQAARLQPSGSAVILSLRQGDTAADPAVFIFLNVNAGETVLGRAWSVSRETRGKGTPQVVKRWQPNAGSAPLQKAFSSGYAMQLELGQPSNGWIPGKIFLSLPDAEKTCLAGLFYIESPGSQRPGASYPRDPANQP
ncbi:MAG: hypothetical protein ABSH38_09490 [Verrucomicrobiota bacterium]